ncbi:MAG: Ig-like surface protein [Oscillospiraceae bacterium]|nr:Ig-like surface protein [Oscillospiraceae bacterium]
MILKKFITFMLSASMVLTSFSHVLAAGSSAGPVTAGSFSDTGGHWAASAIEKWAGYGVLNGDQGAFRPDESITRGELATVLDQLMGYQTEVTNTFPDVQQGAWYEQAVLKASAAGVLLGDDLGNAAPTANITREQAATMLARALGVSSAGGEDTKFSDAADISSWAQPYVFGMEAAGYITGYDNAFYPQEDITRAEVVTILDHAIKAYYNQAGTYTDTVDGLAIIKADGVVLKDATVSGDLIVADGVAGGSVTLEGTTVAGSLIIRGGDTDTVTVDSASSVASQKVEKLYSSEELSGGTVLRNFTLAGSYSGGVINCVPVEARAAAYLWDNEAKSYYSVPFTAGNIAGNFVELRDMDADGTADGAFIVQRQDSATVWDADMHWLNGAGASTEPVVEDATGEDAFDRDYVIPMGERLLTGYGLGDWSGSTDFHNIIGYADETGSTLVTDGTDDLNYYWPQHDYYNAESNDTLTMLTHYKTYQQTTSSNCGLAAALTVLDWYGQRGDLNDNDLVGLRGLDTWGGATELKPLETVFTNLSQLGVTSGWTFESSYDDPEKLFDPDWIQSTLAAGYPIMVGWNSFGGHWQVIIGYDDMGTDTTADDVLILMDPYDSTDDRNDGYGIQSYERLAYGVQSFDDDVNYSETIFLVAIPDTDWSNQQSVYDGDGSTIVKTSSAMDFGAAYGSAVESSWVSYRDTAADIQTYYPDTYIWGTGDDALAGPATGSYRHSGDVVNSSYYSHFDFYNMVSNDHLTMLTGFQTTQQTTEWTCGLASALMNMEWFGKNDDNNLTEIDLAAMRQNGQEGATTVNGLEEVFSNLNTSYGQDWAWFTMRDLDEDLGIGGHYLSAGAADNGLIPYLLSQGIPMMIGWDEWGGHWQVVVGYDDMGTDTTQDDVLILADPYDTTDHDQDGYVIESFERLVYGWDASFDEEYAFVVAFPEAGHQDVITEFGMEKPYYTPKAG